MIKFLYIFFFSPFLFWISCARSPSVYYYLEHNITVKTVWNETSFDGYNSFLFLYDVNAQDSSVVSVYSPVKVNEADFYVSSVRTNIYAVDICIDTDGDNNITTSDKCLRKSDGTSCYLYWFIDEDLDFNVNWDIVYSRKCTR